MKKTLGLSMIEILISLLMLSFALLGLDVMEWNALRESKNAYYFAVAVQQFNVMKELLRGGVGPDFILQFHQWQQENASVLPAGRGSISGKFPWFTIAVFWGDIHDTQCTTIQIGESGCVGGKVYLPE